MGIKAKKRAIRIKIRSEEMSRLRDVEKMSYQDIGKIFGVSRQRVWQLVYNFKHKK